MRRKKWRKPKRATTQYEVGFTGINREYDERVKWVTHYSSKHEILLVGEGDFSFSLCLARTFGSASNITATSLDSYDEVVKKFKKANTNLQSLYELGASLLHGVDAVIMKLHPDLSMRKFDRIIFNFPHAGFYRKENDPHQIRMHVSIVDGFFNNARSMLRSNGEIHVSHKTKAPYNLWNLGELARRNFLAMIECIDFKIEDYPGYDHKRGAGKKCDEPFMLGNCCTFKFIVTRPNTEVNLSYAAGRIYRQQPNIPVVIQQHPTLMDFRHPQVNFFERKELIHSPRHIGSCVTNNIGRESFSLYTGCLNHVTNRLEPNAYDSSYFGTEAMSRKDNIGSIRLEPNAHVSSYFGTEAMSRMDNNGSIRLKPNARVSSYFGTEAMSRMDNNGLIRLEPNAHVSSYFGTGAMSQMDNNTPNRLEPNAYNSSYFGTEPMSRMDNNGSIRLEPNLFERPETIHFPRHMGYCVTDDINRESSRLSSAGCLDHVTNRLGTNAYHGNLRTYDAEACERRMDDNVHCYPYAMEGTYMHVESARLQSLGYGQVRGI